MNATQAWNPSSDIPLTAGCRADADELLRLIEKVADQTDKRVTVVCFAFANDAKFFERLQTGKCTMIKVARVHARIQRWLNGDQTAWKK